MRTFFPSYTLTLALTALPWVCPPALHAQALEHTSGAQPAPFDPAQAEQRASALVAQMTREEKVQFLSSGPTFSLGKATPPGNGAGYIDGIPRLGIPPLAMVDSGVGTGTTGGDQSSSVFPATIAIASSWDRALSYQYGAQIGAELRAQGFGMGLGGGVNLGRDPRYGRIFEYLGEDPQLAGELIAQRSAGTLSQHVIPSIKHFVANEQETGRTVGSSTVDERTLRELYALPFEIAIKETPPAIRTGSVMCAYNQVAIDGANPEFNCESSRLLTDVIKTEWGFKGEVQSDWGGVHNVTKAFLAGLDEREDESGVTLDLSEVPESRIDDAVRRRLYVMMQAGVMEHPAVAGGKIDYDAARRFSQHAEEQSIVLLKNDSADAKRTPALPLKPSALTKGIVIVGPELDRALPVGGGSGNVRRYATGTLAGSCVDRRGRPLPTAPPNECYWWDNPWLPVSEPLLEAIHSHLEAGTPITYIASTDHAKPYGVYTPAQRSKAVIAARTASAVIFVLIKPGREQADLVSLDGANFGESFQYGGVLEKWGYCGSDMDGCVNKDLTEPAVPYVDQVAMLKAVSEANSNTIVVIESGNPILMPWLSKVSAVLDAWYPGEGGGPAIANVLFGTVNPSGKLPITFPAHDTDTPAWGTNGSYSMNPVFQEKLEIGYRWYESRNIKPLFEFGFGLSYTTFAYSNLKVVQNADRSMSVTFELRNTGNVAGAEVPQIYLGVRDPEEPPKRLVGWDKVFLEPGESKRIAVEITPRMQSIWDTSGNTHQWKCIPGSKVYIGASSSDIRLR
jgi:beta-glucosidase